MSNRGRPGAIHLCWEIMDSLRAYFSVFHWRTRQKPTLYCCSGNVRSIFRVRDYTINLPQHLHTSFQCTSLSRAEKSNKEFSDEMDEVSYSPRHKTVSMGMSQAVWGTERASAGAHETIKCTVHCFPLTVKNYCDDQEVGDSNKYSCVRVCV